MGSIVKRAPKYQQPLMFATLTLASSTSIRKRLSEFIRKVTRFRRKPATHMFVLMISSTLHSQKPAYAVPVQCVPYAGLKEVDIRRLVSALVREMISHGMNAGKHLCLYLTLSCIGLVSNGEFNYLRTKGYTRPLSVLQVRTNVRIINIRTTFIASLLS